jgi:serine/threonine protein kinase
MTTKYTLLSKIGEGAFSKVYNAVPIQNVVAVKRYDKADLEAGVLEHKILSKCQHPQIIPCLSFEQTDTTCDLILKHYPQDLRKYLNVVNKINNPGLVKSYLWQILSALKYLHETQRLIHTDVKPANLLINREGNLVVCDFSSSVYEEDFEERKENWRGTLSYRAPECLLGADSETQLCFGTAMDMWSVGCVVHEMLQGKLLFSGDSEIDQLFQIFRLCGTPSEESWPDVHRRADWKSTYPRWPSTLEKYLQKLTDCEPLRDLLRQILVLDPQQRIAASAALQHPYFKDCVWHIRLQNAKIAETIEDERDGSEGATARVAKRTETVGTLPDQFADSVGDVAKPSQCDQGPERPGAITADDGSI